MKLEDFYRQVNEHPDLQCVHVSFADAPEGDRVIVARRSGDRCLGLSLLTIDEQEWPAVESALLGLSPPVFPPISLDEVRRPPHPWLGWNRSVLGLLKHRFTRSYSVETLVAHP